MRQVMHKIVGIGAAAVAIASGQELALSERAQAQFVSAIEIAQESAPSAESDAPTPEPESPPASNTISVTEPSANPIVLNSGAEPRQVLRMTPTIGAEQQTIMDMTTQVAIAIDGAAQPAFTAPGTRLVMDSVVTDIDEAGLITVDFAYVDVQLIDSSSLPPQVIELMRSQVSSMIGTTGTIVIDAQGGTQSFTLVTPETLEPTVRASMEQMAQSFQQISSPLPTEAVGIGAIWQVPQEILINGAVIDSLATFELVDVNGEQIELAISIEQTGEVPISNLLPIPDNVNVSDQRLNSTGTGSTYIDLNQIMPLGSDLTVNTQSTTTVTEAGLSATLAADVEMNMILVSDDFELPTRALEDEAPVTLQHESSR